ncbi:MAG: hypothetical protein GKS05_08790 [Nitrospirales bacterium]|nr:hypothetical protein [Nitrospirales bacterium]
MVSGPFREDTQQTHLVRVEKPFPYDVTLTTQYQRILNDSNLAVFDYTKNVFSVILTWTY